MPTEVQHIRREHVEAFIAHLLERWKPTTASVRYRALSAFWRWAVEDGEVSKSPMARMKPPILPESAPGAPRRRRASAPGRLLRDDLRGSA